MILPSQAKAHLYAPDIMSPGDCYSKDHTREATSSHFNQTEQAARIEEVRPVGFMK